MENGWPDSTVIFDIWDHFENHVIEMVDLLSPGNAAEFRSEESSGVALAVEVTRSSDGPGYLVVVESPDPYNGSIDRLTELGWGLRGLGDNLTPSALLIERTCAKPRDVATTLSTMLRESIGMRNPWFVGLAPHDYSVFAEVDYQAEQFDPHAPMDRMDLLVSVGISLREAYGPFMPMVMDGAFLVRSRLTSLLIRPDQEVEEVWFTWTINSDVQARGSAARLTGNLNDHSSFVHFKEEGDEVWGSYTLPAGPLVPGHLYRVINAVGELISSVLDATTGGAGEAVDH